MSTSISKLAFPLSETDPSNLYLKSLELTTTSSSSSLLSYKFQVTRTGRDHDVEIISAGDKKLIEFIQNETTTSTTTPLLVKVPNQFTNLKITFCLKFSDQHLQSLKETLRDRTPLSIYDEIIILKCPQPNKADSRNSYDFGALIKNKDNVRSIGSIDLFDPDHNTSKNKALPIPNSSTSPITLTTSIHLSSQRDVGPLQFYILSKDAKSGIISPLIRFSFYREKASTITTTDNAIATTTATTMNYQEPQAPPPLNDGPVFRKAINELEDKIPILKNSIQNLLQQGHTLETALKNSMEAKLNFITSLQRLSHDNNNPMIKELVFTKIDPILKKSTTEDDQLLKNMKANILTPMNSIFTNNNVNALNSNKKFFEEESSKYYTWLNKYLSSSKSSSSTTQQSSSNNGTTTTMAASTASGTVEKFLNKKKNFELSKLDYLNYLNEVGNNNISNFDLTNSLISFINNTTTNSDPIAISQNSKTEFKQKIDQLEFEKRQTRKKIDAARNEEELETAVHSALTKSNTTTNAPTTAKVYKAGILYTYGGQNRQGWHKQWIVLENSILKEYADWRKGSDLRGTPIDIALCSIRPVASNEKRKYCFEIITSKGIKNVYQATSELEKESWIKALYDAGQLIRFTPTSPKENIHHQLPATASGSSAVTSSPEQQRKRAISSVSLKNLQLVQAIDSSNLKCCDCGKTEGVEWISINLLCIFCVQCSSSHRNLGTSISKVRSLKLDNFNQEQTSLLLQINNSKMNEIYEFYASNNNKINGNSPDNERLEYITNKYRHGKYLRPLPSAGNNTTATTSPNNILLHGLRDRDFYQMLWAIKLGAKLDMQLEKNDTSFSLLEYALTKSDNKVFDIAEFLLLNGFPLQKDINPVLPVSHEARAYWEDKVEKYHGSSTVTNNGATDRSKENYQYTTRSQLPPQRALPRLNTTNLDDANTSGNLQRTASERKFTSPTSATARYSRNLIRKITNNTSHNN